MVYWHCDSADSLLNLMTVVVFFNDAQCHPLNRGSWTRGFLRAAVGPVPNSSTSISGFAVTGLDPELKDIATQTA